MDELFTDKQANAIRRALKDAGLKPDADWEHRILPDITTVLVDLLEGNTSALAVVYPSTKTRQLTILRAALAKAKQAYGQLSEGDKWFLDDLSSPRRYLDTLNDTCLPVERATKESNPHVRVQPKGAPKNLAMRLMVTRLMEIFESATGEPAKVYSSQHAADGYDGNFYKFAVACLGPLGLVPRKTLGSAILAAYREKK